MFYAEDAGRERKKRVSLWVVVRDEGFLTDD